VGTRPYVGVLAPAFCASETTLPGLLLVG
jgi:hypothetical protein